MNCLANICYVCLEKKDKSLINIYNSSVNEDIIDIIGYLPFNLAWLKNKRILLICEECCVRLRETSQFLAICHKNSTLVQSYMDKLNSGSISNTDNEAELYVHLNNIYNDINKIKLKDEEIYTVQPIIEEDDMFVNVDDFFVKEEDTWKREVVEDKEESPVDNNNATGSSDNKMHSDISVNSNTYITHTDSDSSGFTSKQVHTTSKKKLNTPAKKSFKCSTCSKSFNGKKVLQRHARVHTGEKPYKCSRCEKCFVDSSNLTAHIRIHTGEKPYECSRCKKSFSQTSTLVRHMRIHTGEKPYECSRCKRCFSQQSNLVRHMWIHTGEKLYECARNVSTSN